MKTRTRITIERRALRGLLEQHLADTLVGSHRLHEFTISRNGSIEMVVDPDTTSETPLLDAAEQTGEPVQTGEQQES